MTIFQKLSSLFFAFWVLQYSQCLAESVAPAEDSKSPYARTIDKMRGVSPSLLDSIYYKSRQSRCVTCYEDRPYGDDHRRYYSSYAARSGDDRASSWYYPSYDRYDDRTYRGGDYGRHGSPATDRYGVDRYVADRYGGADRYATPDRYAGYRDDPYGSRPSYDRYDTRTRGQYERPSAYDRGEGRGYSYDNRDRYYGSDRGSDDYYGGRDRYYDRSRYGASGVAGSTTSYGGYDRQYYDRYTPRYDYRHNRQWDDSYREKSIYDDSYYAKNAHEDRRYLPEPSYNSPAILPCGVRRPNCPYSPQEEGTRVTSDTIDSGHYNVGVSQTTYNTNSNTNHNESSKGSGSSAGWSYMREDEQPSKGGSNSGSYASNNIKKDRSSSSSNQQSSGYGALLDRSSNLIAVEPVKSNENANDSMTSSDMQKDQNGDGTPKRDDTEQNS